MPNSWHVYVCHTPVTVQHGQHYRFSSNTSFHRLVCCLRVHTLSFPCPFPLTCSAMPSLHLCLRHTAGDQVGGQRLLPPRCLGGGAARWRGAQWAPQRQRRAAAVRRVHATAECHRCTAHGSCHVRHSRGESPAHSHSLTHARTHFLTCCLIHSGAIMRPRGDGVCVSTQFRTKRCYWMYVRACSLCTCVRACVRERFMPCVSRVGST